MALYRFGTRTLALTLILLLVGCTVPAFVVPVPKAPPRDYIAEMKAYARVHHLAYWIFCLDWNDNPDQQFQAMFCDSVNGDCPLVYIEDGMRRWQAAQGPTQQEAARRLLREVALKGMIQAEHNEAALHQKMENRQCPPPIEGKAE